VPGIALSQFFGDETAVGSGDNIIEEALLGFFIHASVAPDIASFQQGRADRQILPGHAYHFVDRTAALSHLETEIP